MARWFRMYDGVLDDPKVQRLPADLFKVWVNLLCLASRHEGDLPCIEDIAFALRMTDVEARKALNLLAEHCLIDETADGGLEPHNWNGRQFQSDNSAARVAKHRKKRTCNVTPTVTETPPDTETDTDTDTGNAREARDPPAPKGYPEGFQLLWSEFPTTPNSSKATAFKAWSRLSADDRSQALYGAGAYREWLENEKTRRPRDPPPVMHLSTYLNQRRWESLLEGT